MRFLETQYPRLVTLAFSPDGRKLALLSAEDKRRALEIWNTDHMDAFVLNEFILTDDAEKPEQTDGENVPEALLRWSSDGTYLALARKDGAIDVWFPYESKPEHLFSFSFEESCQTLAWGNIHSGFVVGGANRICYWASPYIESPMGASLPFIYKEGVIHPLPITSLAFSADDSCFVSGGSGGELLRWNINPRFAPPTYDGCTLAPRALPITNLWFSPDGMRLLVEQRDTCESQESSSWTKSMLFQQTGNWLSFGSVEQDLLGWSPNSQRIVGIRQEPNSTLLWLEQLDAGTGACLGRRPIDISTRELLAMALVKNETRVVWCVRDPESRVFNLQMDTLPF